MQTWEKLGCVYREDGNGSWRASHAYIPTAFIHSPGRIRVILAFRDEWSIGRVGYVDVDAADPTRVLEVSERAGLDVGRPGTFDEHGVSPLSLVKLGTELYLYYAGWQRSQSVRYFLFTGLAKSTDHGETFQRCSEVPVLDRCDGELLVRSGGYVYEHNGVWLLAYMGGSRQTIIHGQATPTYDLMTMSSLSPTRWAGAGTLSLEPRRPAEFGFGRPWVISEGGRCRMWLSVRSVTAGYSLTYAESDDGLRWVRHDDAIRFVGKDGEWDSRERSCASLVDTEAGRFMFYNGNDYGATGFGVARLCDDDFASRA